MKFTLSKDFMRHVAAAIGLLFLTYLDVRLGTGHVLSGAAVALAILVFRLLFLVFREGAAGALERWTKESLWFLPWASLVTIVGLFAHIARSESLGLLSDPSSFIQQVLLVLLLGGWAYWSSMVEKKSDRAIVVQSAVNQFLGLSGLFLSLGLLKWDRTIGLQSLAGYKSLIVVTVSWLIAYATAQNVLRHGRTAMRSVLASAWGLIVAECAWLFSTWLVNYVLLDGFIIIPQAAVVVTALGYCFSGIYLTHVKNKLSRVRLWEYLLIGLGLILIVIAGTKWNGHV